MINVDEAERLILSQHIGYGNETVPLMESLGCVTAGDWKADTDFPPFDRVTMDGIAIRFSDYEKGLRTFRLLEIQKAGEAPKKLDELASCIEIMTGAVLSEGADTVIPYEEIAKENDCFSVKTEKVVRGQNIHFRGSDRKKGEVVLPGGRVVSAAETGIAASIGLTQITVAKLPSVALISTGDELVPIDQKPLAHQIRRSNIYSVQALLKQFQIAADIFHLPDDKSILKDDLRQKLTHYDLIILSGGVSKGKYDHIPEVLGDLGVVTLFHEIAQRPGKPFFMGKKENRLIFAFPGNPVSTFLCAVRYLLPWIRQVVFHQPNVQEFAVLTEDVRYKKTLTCFMQVSLSNTISGQLCATPRSSKGSGDFIHLAETDAFIELPSGTEIAAKGMAFKIFRYR